jgi:hypothetical protein
VLVLVCPYNTPMMHDACMVHACTQPTQTTITALVWKNESIKPIPTNVLGWVGEEHDKRWHVCVDGSEKKIRKGR